MPAQDPLYHLFEQHLLNALVENESTEDFLNRVVQDYLGTLDRQGMIPRGQISIIESDLKEEVLEMYRKKTYGHFSLASFRKNSDRTANKSSARKEEKPPVAAVPTKRRRSC